MIDRKTAARFAAVLLLFILAMMALSSAAKAEFEDKLPAAARVTCLVPWDAPGAWGYAYLDGRIFLSPYVCNGLRSRTSSQAFADSVAVLYHEWMHAYYQVRSEGEAECDSLFFLRYILRHKWGLSPNAAQRVYTLAWRTHMMRATFYPQYRGNCNFGTPDLVP